MSSVIEVNDLSWRKQDKLILNEINWSVRQGEHWVIVGLNGSGKTSLLKMITGYEWPSKGKIHVLGNLFGQTNIHDLRKTIGWVSTSMDERFVQRASDTALEVVLSGKYASVGLYEEISVEDIQTAYRVLKQVKIDHLAEQAYRTLSQGEKRRTMIARALMAKPKLLILDEPCNGLDIYIREQLLETIEAIMKGKDGPTILYVTHHLEEVVPSITHALLLKNGEIVASGEKSETLTNENLSDIYKLAVSINQDRGRLWLQVKK